MEGNRRNNIKKCHEEEEEKKYKIRFKSKEKKEEWIQSYSS